MLALEEKTGVKNPRLLSRPRLRTDCRKYQRAYAALNNSRQFNPAGIQPLTIAEMRAYIELADISRGYPAEKFLRIMQQMDAAQLEWQLKKQK